MLYIVDVQSAVDVESMCLMDVKKSATAYLSFPTLSFPGHPIQPSDSLPKDLLQRASQLQMKTCQDDGVSTSKAAGHPTQSYG